MSLLCPTHSTGHRTSKLPLQGGGLRQARTPAATDSGGSALQRHARSLKAPVMQGVQAADALRTPSTTAARPFHCSTDSVRSAGERREEPAQADGLPLSRPRHGKPRQGCAAGRPQAAESASKKRTHGARGGEAAQLPSPQTSSLYKGPALPLRAVRRSVNTPRWASRQASS